jgi:hypothetical protein
LGGELWVFLIDLQDLICSLSGEDDGAHVDEHGDADGVHEFVLVFGFGGGRLEGVEEDGVPDGEGVDESELAGVQAADPAQQECFSFDVLQFEDAKQFEVLHLQLLILDLHDALEDGGVVLGIGVDKLFHIVVQILFEHLLLDLHYLLEDRVDVRFSVGHTVQEEIFLFHPK